MVEVCLFVNEMPQGNPWEWPHIWIGSDYRERDIPIDVFADVVHGTKTRNEDWHNNTDRRGEGAYSDAVVREGASVMQKFHRFIAEGVDEDECQRILRVFIKKMGYTEKGVEITRSKLEQFVHDNGKKNKKPNVYGPDTMCQFLHDYPKHHRANIVHEFQGGI